MGDELVNCEDRPAQHEIEKRYQSLDKRLRPSETAPMDLSPKQKLSIADRHNYPSVRDEVSRKGKSQIGKRLTLAKIENNMLSPAAHESMKASSNQPKLRSQATAKRIGNDIVRDEHRLREFRSIIDSRKRKDPES